MNDGRKQDTAPMPAMAASLYQIIFIYLFSNGKN
jgi:hypothetical protein